jgi:hypothetical protein
MLVSTFKPHIPFFLLCVVFFGVVRLHIAVISPFEGPDEGEHFAYILHLRQTGTYPTYEDFSSPIAQQVGQPPLYYTVASLFTAPYTLANVQAGLVKRNPWYGFPVDPASKDNRNFAMMHPDYQMLTRAQARLSNALLYTRGVTVVFGWLALAGVYWGGLALWGNTISGRLWSLLAAIFFGFAPSVIQAFAIVTNDAAVIAFAALSLGGGLHLYKRWDHVSLLILTGIFLAAAALSKVSGLVMIPVVTLAVLMGWWRSRDAGRLSAADIFACVRSLATIGSVVALLAGWWYINGYLRYGDPFGSQPHQQMSWAFNDRQSLEAVIARFPIVLQTLWFNAGWGEVRPEAWGYVVLVTAVIAAIWGILRGGLRFDSRVIILLVMLLLGSAAIFHWMQISDLITGRLYLPYTPALTLLLIYAIRGAPFARLFRSFLAGASGGMAVISAVLVLYPAFVAPVLLDSIPSGLHGDGIDFGPVRFVGYRIENDGIRVGQPFPIMLCWQAADGDMPVPMPHPFSVQLIALEGGQPTGPKVGSRESYLGLGKYTLLQPRKVVCDTLAIPINEPLVSSAEYALLVTLFDAETAASLPGVNADGVPSSKIVGLVQAAH